MFLGELIHSAYFGRLVRSLVKQLGIMAEAVGGYIVEKHFDHELFPKSPNWYWAAKSLWPLSKRWTKQIALNPV
jgi:hypothetical protein